MGKNEFVGFRTGIGEERCGFCQTQENLIQFDVADKIKGLPVTKSYMVCRKCASEKKIVTPRELEDIPIFKTTDSKES